MADLQRIFGCLDMVQSPVRDPQYIMTVAKNSTLFSSKVVMPMSAQGEWRPIVCVCDGPVKLL